MIKIYRQSVHHSAPDDRGARLTVIGEAETLEFEGSAIAATEYLETRIPIGASVAVRHAGGLRSCMNKPSLWLDVRSYQEITQ